MKRIAARKQCTLMEAAYWYNVKPKDDVSSAAAPVNAVYTYRVITKRVDTTLQPDHVH